MAAKSIVRTGMVLGVVLASLATSASAAGTLTELAKLLASDGAVGDAFGTTLSISGDTAIVGSPDDDDNGIDSGSAYVYVRNAGVWSQQQKLTAPDGAASDFFGRFVAISADTAIVGAIRDDDNGTDSGSVYVYVRSAGVWSEQQKLTASDGAAGDLFGSSVSIADDTAIVGAVFGDGNAIDSGSAYVFVRNAGVWSEQQKLTASDGAALVLFGHAVSISGDTVIVGAVLDDDIASNSGSAYVFVRSAGVWSQEQKLKAGDVAAGDSFGSSVSLSGDTVIVGAPSKASNTGSAYVYVRSGTVWSQQQKLTAADAALNDAFGGAVSLSGNTAIVGAANDGDNGTNSGSAYKYARSGTVWSQQQKLTASDGAAFDQFGIDVSLSGDAAIVGAQFHADNGFHSGSAYAFQSLAVTCPPDVTVECTAPTGTPHTLSFTVDEPAGEAVTVTIGVDGSTAQTTNIPAGTPPTSTTIAFPFTYVGLGDHVVDLTASNTSGDMATCSVMVTIVDTTPPVITCALPRTLLWPARRGMIPAGFTASATDACDGPVAVVVTVFSDEANGAAPFSPDATGTSPATLKLRMERAYPGNGRVYLIRVTATDAAGNTAVLCKSAIVPVMPVGFWIVSARAQATAGQALCLAADPLTGIPTGYVQLLQFPPTMMGPQ